MQLFKTYIQRATEEGRLLVAYFTATWCPPSNNFVKITSLFKSVSFVTVDANKGRDGYEFTSVTSMPTFKM